MSKFLQSKPIWIPIENEIDKMNVNLTFEERLDSLLGVTFLITAADFYRLKVNGKIIGHGPARTALGYARIDEYDLTPYNIDGVSKIVIEVAGYHCKSLSTVLQDSFLIAEALKDGKVILSTGRDFKCRLNSNRKRIVDKLSSQRHFGEIYDFSKKTTDEISTVIVREDLRFLHRSAPMPVLNAIDLFSFRSGGAFKPSEKKVKSIHSFPYDGDTGWAFPDDKIDDFPFNYIKNLQSTLTRKDGNFPVELKDSEWIMVDFEKIYAGFIRLGGVAKTDVELILATTEYLTGETFKFIDDFGDQVDQSQPAIKLIYKKGDKIDFESFEPLSFKNLALFVVSGSISVSYLGVRTFMRNPLDMVARKINNSELKTVYDAAVRSFTHNAVDIYTDCPLRERAGWLCDSFFSARAEFFFYENCLVEDDFLQNYLLYENKGEYPKGVVPMCYPSSPTPDKKFIPQWNMWLVLQICEYLTERRRDIDRMQFRPLVYGIIEFLEKYRMENGLIAKLPSWNFVEWSIANSWTEDVNYPTNMLYVGVLNATGKAFNDNKLIEQAERLNKEIINASFCGEYFVDNAIINNGLIKNTNNVSEACQYYAAMFLDIDLDDEKYIKLKEHILSDFNTFDKSDINFCEKNAFLGLYLRLAVLHKLKDGKAIKKCIKDYFLDMSKNTSTLWEYRQDISSHNHGFASYVACILPFADD
ncbi:MAG: hypothetical protein IJV95_01225 [Clostridia bacterium]|nr:hypothetical protein [Clostridia bacterium]